MLPDAKLAQLAEVSRLGEERFAEANARPFGLGTGRSATPPVPAA